MYFVNSLFYFIQIEKNKKNTSWEIIQFKKHNKTNRIISRMDPVSI